MGSIVKEIENLNGLIDEDVLLEACRINKSMIKYVNRGSNRDLKVLFCIYNAYLNLDRVADIYILGNLMGIDRKKIKKAFTVCSPFVTGYKYKKIRFSVFNYLYLYMNHIKSLNKEHKEQIHHLCHILSSASKTLNRHQSQKLAASFIIYYSRINGLLDVGNQMKALFYRPTTTLESIIKSIGDLVNS